MRHVVHVVTHFPYSVQEGVQNLYYNPNVALLRWLPYLGMAIVETSEDYAGYLRHKGHKVHKASDSKPVLLSDEIAPGTVWSPVDGVEVISRLGVDKFHSLGIKGNGVKIAVIDCGIRASHAGLGGRVLEQYDYTGLGIGNYHPPSPSNIRDHGAAVAGCIVGDLTLASPYGARVLGTAPHATLGDFKVFRERLEGESEEGFWAAQAARILAAMNDALSRGYYIYNCSFTDLSALVNNIPWRENPIGVATDRVSGLGVLVVAAAGNWGRPGTISVPASVPSAVAVGGMNVGHDVLDAYTYDLISRCRPWVISRWSSQGPTLEGLVKPDTCGICEMICVLAGRSDIAVDTDGGTSFACPQVAGVAALVYQAIGRIAPDYFRATLPNRCIRPE